MIKENWDEKSEEAEIRRSLQQKFIDGATIIDTYLNRPLDMAEISELSKLIEDMRKNLLPQLEEHSLISRQNIMNVFLDKVDALIISEATKQIKLYTGKMLSQAKQDPDVIKVWEDINQKIEQIVPRLENKEMKVEAESLQQVLADSKEKIERHKGNWKNN